MRKKMITFEEFDQIMSNIKLAWDFEMEMMDISKKYVDKGVLFDYISTSSTFLAVDVIFLLNTNFNLPEDEDIISYYCWECDFGKEKRTIIDTDYKKDPFYLTNNQELYDYLVYLKSYYEEARNGETI